MNYFKGILLLLALIPTVSFSQCNGFHSVYCFPSEDESFRYNSQSKSARFAKGQTSELNIIVYKGQDYRISLCYDENLGSQITFKLLEEKKVKVEKVFEVKRMEEKQTACEVCDGTGDYEGETCYECDGGGEVPSGEEVEVIDKETRMVTEVVKEVLYDNSTDGYAKEIEFSSENNKRIILQITIPGSPKGKIVKTSDMGCLGVLIEHMSTPKSGF